jgi:PAS domain S-box-containing protein
LTSCWGASPIDPGNWSAGLATTALDITERKRAEEALRKSEERFKDLYDNAPLGYHEYDAEGRITNVNRTDLEMLGYTEGEMMGQFMWKFNVEEEIARKEILAKLTGKLPPGRNLERTYRRKDGTTFPVLIEDKLVLDEEGRIKGIRCTIQDITERKRIEDALRQSEQNLRMITDNAHDLIAQLDAELVYRYVSPSYKRMLGYEIEEILGQNAIQTNKGSIHPEDLEATVSAMNQSLSTLEPGRIPYRVVSKNW